MIEPRLARNESARLKGLRKLQIIHTPIEGRFERIIDAVGRVIDAPIIALSLVESDFQWFKASRGIDFTSTARDISICAHLVQSGEPIVVENTLLDARFKTNPLVTDAPHVRFYAGSPVFSAEGHVLGALCALDAKPRTLSASQLQSLRELAELASAELRRPLPKSVQAPLIGSLLHAGRAELIDSRTRLWNLRGIEAVLRCAGEVRCGTELNLINIDLDDFTSVNEQEGYVTGDALLADVARRIVNAIRPCDAAGYPGDDSFLVLLGPVDDASEAIAMAERIRGAISGRALPPNRASVAVTASLGVSCLPWSSVSNLANLFSDSQRAVERAQLQGGDCICVSSKRHVPQPCAVEAIRTSFVNI